MRRSAAVLAAASWIALANGQPICRTYEYAELRDMRRERLEQLYCDYNSAMLGMIHVALEDAKAGRMAASNAAQATSERCAQELDRIERVLDNKFSAKAPRCGK